MHTLNIVDMKEEAKREEMLMAKFVHLDNGDYRFTDFDTVHSSLVGVGEEAMSAGFISLYASGEIKVWEEGSTSLNKGPLETDQEHIQALFK